MSLRRRVSTRSSHAASSPHPHPSSGRPAPRPDVRGSVDAQVGEKSKYFATSTSRRVERASRTSLSLSPSPSPSPVSSEKSHVGSKHSDDDDDEDDDDVQSSDLTSSSSDDEEGVATPDEEDEDEDEKVQAPSKKRKRATPVVKSVTSATGESKGSNKVGRIAGAQQSGKDGAEGEDGGERGETFIAKLPALPAGEVPYADDTLHPNTLAFLGDLSLNNERDWFQARELQFRATKADFDSFIGALGRAIMTVDDTVPELPIKDLTFRIYRDIRFSNDRTPYKTFLAAYYSRSGRKGPWAGYYFSLEPGGKTLLACGLWQPPAPDLALVRSSIDESFERWREVLEDPGFVEFFGGKEGLMKTEDQLKTCPKGYSKEHGEIAMLRLKSFNVRMKFSDEEVLDDGFMDIVTLVIEQMHPFVTLLNSIIRPELSDSE